MFNSTPVGVQHVTLLKNRCRCFFLFLFLFFWVFFRINSVMRALLNDVSDWDGLPAASSSAVPWSFGKKMLYKFTYHFYYCYHYSCNCIHFWQNLCSVKQEKNKREAKPTDRPNFFYWRFCKHTIFSFWYYALLCRCIWLSIYVF